MRARAWGYFAAVSILWGMRYLLIKVDVDAGVPPAFVAWIRVVLGAGRALLVTDLNPVVAVALGVTIRGERPGAGPPSGWC